MISSFFSIMFMLIGVAFIAVIKLYSFVLWRVVPIVGLIYIGIAVVQAEENPFAKHAPHLLVMVTEQDLVELRTWSNRKDCIAQGRILVSSADNFIGFVCEVQLPESKPEPEPPKMSAVCHEEVRYCA